VILGYKEAGKNVVNLLNEQWELGYGPLAIFDYRLDEAGGLSEGADDRRVLAAEIRRYIPEAKLIAILRNPIDRVYSHFLHMVRSGTEPLDDFAQALHEELVGIHKERTFQDYIGRGLY